MRQSLYASLRNITHKYTLEKLGAFLLLTVFVFGQTTVNAASTDLDSIVLSIHGNIECQKEGQKNEFIELDLLSLTNLQSTTITTKQPWTDGPREYTGVRISTLLKHIGAASSEFEAVASNEYMYVLRDIDFDKYPILVAYKIDGEFLDTRKLGPLLIVFPFDDYPELLNESNKAASVWQLIEMQIL